MPDYKKKHVRRVAPKPKHRPVNSAKSAPHSVKKSDAHPQKIRVIRGRRPQRRYRWLKITAVAAFLVAAVMLVNFLLPGGLWDRFSNWTATVGAGEAEIELYGTTALDSCFNGNAYYCLTDSELCAVSNNGKKLFSDTHGYENPILRQGATRALLFNQNGRHYSLYRLRGVLRTGETDDPILTAAIADGGAYAIVTHSAQSASTVCVYDKSGNTLYEWYSAADTVNAVALSPNGKHLVAATLNAVNGELCSKIYMFDYDSAEPVFSTEYEGVVRNLSATGYGFTVATAGGFDCFAWKDRQKAAYTSEYELYLLRQQGNYTITVWNRSGNRQDNRILVFSKKGETLFEINQNGIIGDIAYRYGHIYTVGDTLISMYDTAGTLLGTAACDYGIDRIVPISADRVIAVYGSGLESIEIIGSEENVS